MFKSYAPPHLINILIISLLEMFSYFINIAVNLKKSLVCQNVQWSCEKLILLNVR